MNQAESANWALWSRQVGAVLRLELLRVFLGKRAILLYLLAAVALLPTVLMLLVRLMSLGDGPEPGELITVYAYLYQFLILRFAIYLGCVWVFMNTIRGDLIDRTLHLYFLSPLRREVLLAAKYIAGLVVTTFVFMSVTVLSHCLAALADGKLIEAPLGSHLVHYTLATAFACLGYGGLFLLVGTFVRNPIVPAVLLWGWETCLPFMPVWLKKLTVLHYVNSLVPVRPPDGPLAILATPTPWYFSLPGLVLLTVLLLVLAGRRLRQMEIAYGSD